MNRAEVYAWVGKTYTKPPSPGRPTGRGRRAGRVFIDGPCENCGFSPMGWRKLCPACLATVPR